MRSRSRPVLYNHTQTYDYRVHQCFSNSSVLPEVSIRYSRYISRIKKGVYSVRIVLVRKSLETSDYRLTSANSKQHSSYYTQLKV